jgi:hypothetical protein
MHFPIADIFETTPLVLAAIAGLVLVGFLLIALKKRTAGVTLLLLTIVAAAVYFAVFALLFLGADKSFS